MVLQDTQVNSCRVFAYHPKHIGNNIVLMSPSMYNQLRETSDSEYFFVEITPINGENKAYGFAWYEDNEKFQSDSTYIGLESPLMDTCLVNVDDVVTMRVLPSREIETAASVELQVIGDSVTKIHTEDDLQKLKNRIAGGDVVLGQNTRFLVPFSDIGATYWISLRVVNTEPANVPVKCNEKTTITFDGVSVKPRQADVSFEDVGGLKKQIDLLREVIQLPLEHPEIFPQLGIHPPRGILLYGPPGNGKTMLARALANAIQANFYTVNGPELMSKFVGEGEKKIRQVFEKAKQNAPSIIFFDEIDSFAGKRDSFTAEFEVRIVGQLLSMMDGLADRGNVIIIAATNRPNAIDPALRRPGRFDREIEVGLPSESDRLDILSKYVKQMNLTPDVDLASWAKKTSGYVGADLAALAREAVIRCLRRVFALSSEGHYQQSAPIVVTNADFYDAFKELQPTTLRDVNHQFNLLSWDELLGVDTLKERLLNLVETPLKYPDKLKAMGLTPPTGIILVGSSQSGKKSLALGLAQKLGIQCISVRALDFIYQESSQGSKTLGEIFRKARLSSPSVLLIDKIDLAFSSQLRETTESFLFAENLVDEIRRNRLYENVFVIATARSLENLPQILLDSSVFGHLINMPTISNQDFELLIKSKLKNYIDSEVSYPVLAESVEGLSIGEVIYVCEECLRMSLTHGEITPSHFQQAVATVKTSKNN